jgi:hypothetical protein
MLCAANLVDGCVRKEISSLYALTKQIFGLCDAHGVSKVKFLFDKYCYVVDMLLIRHSREHVVRMMDALVWEPRQHRLAEMMGLTRNEWTSLLTVKTPKFY